MREPGRAFPRGHRLTRRRDFARVFARPRRVAGQAFTILARDNGLGHPRLGMVVAKRRLPKAVARNRLRRLIRESFRIHAGSIDALDIVVLARDPAGQRLAAVLREELTRHWLALGSAGETRQG